MSTIRRGQLPTDHFTIISNDWLRDETLSWAARGLLAWLASHTTYFDITEDAIVAAGPSGRDAVRSMIYALEQAGYLHRARVPVVTGGSTVDYILADPRTAENPPLGSSGKSDPRPDQAEQGISAGQPNGGFSPPRSSPEDQKKTNTKTPSSLRATRVPDDFMPDEELRAWFVEEKLPAVIDGKREHEKFMDYWLGCPGVRGRKLDWRRTWRNWMREAADRASRNGVRQPGNSLVPTSGAPMNYKPSTTDQRIAQGQALAAKYREQGL